MKEKKRMQKEKEKIENQRNSKFLYVFRWRSYVFHDTYHQHLQMTIQNQMKI